MSTKKRDDNVGPARPKAPPKKPDHMPDHTPDHQPEFPPKDLDFWDTGNKGQGDGPDDH